MAFTFFFRDRRVLDSIVKHVVPTVMGRSLIRVWDAGCASGEEAYSLAVLLFESLWPFASSNLRIDATDIEENSLFADTIVNGIYHSDLLKGTSHRDLLDKYSQAAAMPGYIQFDAALRSCIFYQRHDLLCLQPIGDNFSLVVCKNVLIHIPPRLQTEVVRVFHRALLPGGCLALDEQQSLPSDASEIFERFSEDGQLYRKVEI